MTSAPTNVVPSQTGTDYRIVAIRNCPSLSGKSTLTYHIGCDPAKAIQLRIAANSASGFFSQEWVPFSVIRQEFDKVAAGKTITSFLLHPLFNGKSVNTPAFLFAVLKHEGLVRQAKEKQRQYERVDAAAFVAMVQALIASGVSLKWDPPAKASKKPQGNAKPINTGKKSAIAVVPSSTANESPSAEKPSVATPKAVTPPADHAESKATSADGIPRFADVKPEAIAPKAKAGTPAKKATAKKKK